MNSKKLVSYAVICAAKNGNTDAMQVILHHYDRLVSHYSKRTLYDEYGNSFAVVDTEIKNRIQARLMYQIIYGFDITKLPKGEKIE